MTLSVEGEKATFKIKNTETHVFVVKNNICILFVGWTWRVPFAFPAQSTRPYWPCLLYTIHYILARVIYKKPFKKRVGVKWLKETFKREAIRYYSYVLIWISFKYIFLKIEKNLSFSPMVYKTPVAITTTTPPSRSKSPACVHGQVWPRAGEKRPIMQTTARPTKVNERGREGERGWR